MLAGLAIPNKPAANSDKMPKNRPQNMTETTTIAEKNSANYDKSRDKDTKKR